MHLDHPRLLITNFAQCFRFYRDVMGFKATWGSEETSYASFMEQNGEGTTLALFQRRAMAEVVGTAELPSDTPCQDRVVLIFQVQNVDAAVERLRGRGAQIVREPQDFTDWGIRSAYVRDPDGNLLELNSGLEPAQWSEELRAAAREFGGEQAGKNDQDRHG